MVYADTSSVPPWCRKPAKLASAPSVSKKKSADLATPGAASSTTASKSARSSADRSSGLPSVSTMYSKPRISPCAVSISIALFIPARSPWS